MFICNYNVLSGAWQLLGTACSIRHRMEHEGGNLETPYLNYRCDHIADLFKAILCMLKCADLSIRPRILGRA